jgi:hypothetical protein
MEGWKNGMMEDWNSGMLEDWNDGKKRVQRIIF